MKEMWRRLAVRATALGAAAALGITLGFHGARPASSTTESDAEKAPMDGWYSYDYQSGVGDPPADNVFFRTVRNDDGDAWARDSRWSIDTPETPDSVLALLRYQQWGLQEGVVTSTPLDPIDLRGKCVTFDLTGRQLELRGGHATFWVMSSVAGQRWHTSRPVEVGRGEWAPTRVDIDATHWRRSWAGDPTSRDLGVRTVMATAVSYGIAFIGFDGEPTGALGLRDFNIGEC